MYKIIIASILVLLMTSCGLSETVSLGFIGAQTISLIDNSWNAKRQIKEKQRENDLREISASNLLGIVESLNRIKAKID